MSKEPVRPRRKERKNITSGVVHVNASFNNTMITITDVQGNTISWASAGKLGFKSGEGFRKWNPAQQQALRLKVLKHLKEARAKDDK